MSIVIIGDRDRMVNQYKKTCRNCKCKVKVSTQMNASLDKQVGSLDLLVLFTNTVSHKMIRYVLSEAGSGTEVIYCHASNDAALTETPEGKCTVCAL